MKILVGSLNPVKINCTKSAFEKYFKEVEVIGYTVKSGVPDQPISEEETFQEHKTEPKHFSTKMKKKN
jgi:inosine/xanthosine triphosphatase